MKEREQLMVLAGPLGACFLNGKPADLDMSGRLPRVSTKDGQESVCFNLSVIQHVIIHKGGRFITRDQNPYPRLPA